MRTSSRSIALHSTWALVALVGLSAAAQQSDFTAPFVPTPQRLVRMGLEMAGLEAGQLHYDLGSGDGRWVITAARDFGVRSVGFEIDAELVAASRSRIAALGLGEHARIEKADLFEADFRDVDLVTTYLLPAMLERLQPIFEQQLKPGARVVSYDFPMPAWRADRVVTIPGEGRLSGLEHKLFFYRR